MAAVILALTACGGSDDRVVVAAGTTLVDSGVLDSLADAYESTHRGVNVSIVGRATREVLELGAQGAADVLITHAPAQEAAFLANHPEAASMMLFTSRFLIVGPGSRVPSLAGSSVSDVLHAIAAGGWDWVSRRDGSGTYEREAALWSGAGLDPIGESWYIETGQGMGNSLQVADQREAFILVEEGTFLVSRGTLRLEVVETSGGDLINPYTVIVPAPDAAAEDFVAWLLSAEGRAALHEANREAFGRDVFRASGTGTS